MNEETPTSRRRTNGSEAARLPAGVVSEAIAGLEQIEVAVRDFAAASLLGMLSVANDVSARNAETLGSIGATGLDTAERVASRATAATARVAETVIDASAGTARRALVAGGETAGTGLEQATSVARAVLRHGTELFGEALQKGSYAMHQAIDLGRDGLERTFEASGSVAEALGRLVERILRAALATTWEVVRPGSDAGLDELEAASRPREQQPEITREGAAAA